MKKITLLLAISFIFIGCKDEPKPPATNVKVMTQPEKVEANYNLQMTMDTLFYGIVANRWRTPAQLVFNDYFEGTHILLKHTWAFGDEARNGNENVIWELRIPEKLNVTKGVNYLDSAQYQNGLAIQTPSGHILAIPIIGSWDDGNNVLYDTTKPAMKVMNKKVVVSYKISNSDVEGDERTYSTHNVKTELPIISL